MLFLDRKNPIIISQNSIRPRISDMNGQFLPNNIMLAHPEPGRHTHAHEASLYYDYTIEIGVVSYTLHTM